MSLRNITLSVVSHNQADLVQQLLADLDDSGAGLYLKQVIVVNNLGEDVNYVFESAPINVIRNAEQLGFSANHNQAFEHCDTEFFCVINPDIRISANPFPKLLKLMQIKDVGIVAPNVYDSYGNLEDSARLFPTPSKLLKKILGINDGRYPQQPECDFIHVDWVGGMFMIFSSKAFKSIGGFDEGFFLYYEDVDICARMWNLGNSVVQSSSVSVVHDAQRSSHKSLRYFIWHLSSMCRYFLKHWLRLPKTLNVSDRH